jgi:hypothetical protein
VLVTVLDESTYHIAPPSSIQSAEIGNDAAQFDASDTTHPVVMFVQFIEYTENDNPFPQAFVPPGLE